MLEPARIFTRCSNFQSWGGKVGKIWIFSSKKYGKILKIQSNIKCKPKLCHLQALFLQTINKLKLIEIGVSFESKFGNFVVCFMARKCSMLELWCSPLDVENSSNARPARVRESNARARSKPEILMLNPSLRGGALLFFFKSIDFSVTKMPTLPGRDTGKWFPPK